MDWILDHLQIVIAIAAAVAYWLNQARKGAASGDEADEGSAFPAPGVDDGAEAERARRIREEIRRKIAERARGMPPALEPAPPSLYREEPMAPPPMTVPTPMPSAPAPRDDWQMAMVLERQQKLREQMEALERARRLEAAQPAMPVMPAAPAIASSLPVGSSWRSDLKSKAGLRRAVVLREVLGPPVSLR